MRTRFPIVIFIIIAVTVFGVGSVIADEDQSHETGEALPVLDATEGHPYFSHIHGVGFASGSNSVFFATHVGLWLFENGVWRHSGNGSHDFMGFAPFRGGFYASGHPDLTTDLPNPLGLVRVTREGSKIDHIRFSGEHDFHLISTGLSGRHLYIYNETPGDDLEPGLHYSTNHGRKWRRASGTFGYERPVDLASHPTDPSILALIAGNALYYSDNSGQTFLRVKDTEHLSALTFLPDGKQLLIGGRELRLYNLVSGAFEQLPTPAIGDRTIAHIAVNPDRPAEIVVVAADASAWLTHDRGVSWIEIAANGLPTVMPEKDQPCDCGA